MKKLFMILLLSVLFLNCLASHQDSERVAFIKEVISFLKTENMSPDLMSDSEIIFSYSDHWYFLKIKDGDVRPFVMVLSSKYNFDEIITKRFIGGTESSDGIVISYDNNSYSIRNEFLALDAESFKYAFYRILNKIVDFQKYICSMAKNEADEVNRDQERWKIVNDNDEDSIRAYLIESVDYEKRHIDEAKAMLARLAHQKLDTLWSAVDKTNYNSVKQFVDNLDPSDGYLRKESETVLLRLEQDRNKLEAIRNGLEEAKRRCRDGEDQSLEGLNKIISLFETAKQTIGLDEESQRLYDGLMDDYLFWQFLDSKTLDNASLYLSTVKNGKNRFFVQKWYEDNMSELDDCLKLRNKIKSPTLSFDDYVSYSGINHTSEYHKYLKSEKRKYLRSQGGRNVRLGIGALYYVDDIELFDYGLSVDLKIGNVFRPVSWTIGVLALNNYPYYGNSYGFDGNEIYDYSYDLAIIVNTMLKVNLFKLGKKGRLYISPGLGYNVSNEDYNAIARIGFGFRFIDVSVFGLYHFNGYATNCAGLSFSFYL